MPYDGDFRWMREYGVPFDPKGRPIVSFPDEPDVNFGEVDGHDDREPTIAELMRPDVTIDRSGSRGRRRRGRSKAVAHYEPPPMEEPRRTHAGRPAVGAETRVYVQTMIAQRTKELLAKNRMTLADVFSAVADGLADEP